MKKQEQQQQLHGAERFLIDVDGASWRLTPIEQSGSLPPPPPPPPFRGEWLLTWLPTLDVMMTIVFLKLTVRPWESVRRPSSRICSIMLNTSGWAFSISSNSSREYGFLRTTSVSWPPSS